MHSSASVVEQKSDNSDLKCLIIMDSEVDDEGSFVQKLSDAIQKSFNGGLQIVGVIINAGKEVDSFNKKIQRALNIFTTYGLSKDLLHLGYPHKPAKNKPRYQFDHPYAEYQNDFGIVGLTLEGFRKMVADADCIDCTAPPIELYELMQLVSNDAGFLHFLKKKTLNLYGSTNTNKELCDYLMFRDPSNATDKITAHYLMLNLYKSFTTWLFENGQMLGSVSDKGGAAFDTRMFPICGSFNQALLDEKEATGLGLQMGLFAQEQAKKTACNQAGKLTIYLLLLQELAPAEYILVMEKLLTIINTNALARGKTPWQEQEFYTDPLRILLDFNFLMDDANLGNEELFQLLTQVPQVVRDKYCSDGSTELKVNVATKFAEDSFLSQLRAQADLKDDVISIIPSRCFKIWSRTVPYAYQTTLADYFTALKIFELTQLPAERYLMTIVMQPHVFSGLSDDKNYAKFAAVNPDAAHMDIYYPRPLDAKEAQDFVGYMDLAFARLHATGQLLFPESLWRQTYAKAGLDKCSPYHAWQIFKNTAKCSESLRIAFNFKEQDQEARTKACFFLSTTLQNAFVSPAPRLSLLSDALAPASSSAPNKLNTEEPKFGAVFRIS